MLMTIITDDDVFEVCNVVGPKFLLDDEDDDDEGEVVVYGTVTMNNHIVLDEFVKSNISHVCYLVCN